MTNDEKEMAQSIIRDHQNRIIELEKENAELKKSLENCEGEIRTLYTTNQRLNQMIEIKDKSSTDYINKIAELEQKLQSLQLLLDIQNFLIEPEHKEEKKHLQDEGWVDVSMPCTKADAIDCITKQEGLCTSEDGKCHIRINLSKLCGC